LNHGAHGSIEDEDAFAKKVSYLAHKFALGYPKRAEQEEMETSPYLVGISTQLYGVAKVSKGLVPPPFWISSAKIRRKKGRRNEVVEKLFPQFRFP
jgi:hypothetical protein